jgi:RimJ/RimL family protein N-acetyltransferase/predicted GNAT family N-acyltransferase
MTLSLALGAWSDLALHAKPIRQQVFVRELALPEPLAEDEFDRAAHHAVLFDSAKAIGTARLLGDGSIGRIAVTSIARRRGHGGLLLNALTELAVERGFAQVKLSALGKAIGLYERHGFRTLGEPYQESGVIHQNLFKPLKGTAPWPDDMPPELHTPDLLLRPGRYTDAPAIRAAMQSWDVVRFLALPPWPYLHGHALGWMNTYIDQWQRNKTAPFVIIEKTSGELVGTAGLRAGALADARPALGNVGYWIARPHWGKGYATQALKALLAYGFDTLGMNRIDACHLAENRASGRVMLRAGMQQEGIRRGYSKGRDGQWHDDVLYSMLSTDPR